MRLQSVFPESLISLRALGESQCDAELESIPGVPPKQLFPALVLILVAERVVAFIL